MTNPELRQTNAMKLFAWSAAVAALLIMAPVNAKDGVLVSGLPARADRAQVVAIVRQAFEGRGWTIAVADADGVSATLKHYGYDARMRVSIDGARLVYQETATRTQMGNPVDAQHGFRFPSATPVRWIRNLRNDIARQLVLLSSAAQSSP